MRKIEPTIPSNTNNWTNYSAEYEVYEIGLLTTLKISNVGKSFSSVN